MKKIDISTWYRKEHFEFYSGFEQPFFNVCATVDVSKTLNYCKENKLINDKLKFIKESKKTHKDNFMCLRSITSLNSLLRGEMGLQKIPPQAGMKHSFPT